MADFLRTFQAGDPINEVLGVRNLTRICNILEDIRGDGGRIAIVKRVGAEGRGWIIIFRPDRPADIRLPWDLEQYEEDGEIKIRLHEPQSALTHSGADPEDSYVVETFDEGEVANTKTFVLMFSHGVPSVVYRDSATPQTWDIAQTTPSTVYVPMQQYKAATRTDPAKMLRYGHGTVYSNEGVTEDGLSIDVDSQGRRQIRGWERAYGRLETPNEIMGAFWISYDFRDAAPKGHSEADYEFNLFVHRMLGAPFHTARLTLRRFVDHAKYHMAKALADHILADGYDIEQGFQEYWEEHQYQKWPSASDDAKVLIACGNSWGRGDGILAKKEDGGGGEALLDLLDEAEESIKETLRLGWRSETHYVAHFPEYENTLKDDMAELEELEGYLENELSGLRDYIESAPVDDEMNNSIAQLIIDEKATMDAIEADVEALWHKVFPG